MKRREFISAAAMATGAALVGCGGRSRARRPGEPAEIVFAHGKHPRYAVLGDLIRQFEAEHAGLRVREVVLPAASDEMHQFYVINLGGGAADVDVVDMDVIWVPEFARAGWLADLTPHLPAAELAPLNAAAREADTLDGRLYGVPWFVDAGVLYARRDLLERHGFAPPQTLPELAGQARAILAAERDPRLYGFVWQGMQYEGLVCAALEFIRGNGGDVLRDGGVALTGARTVDALRFVRGMIDGGITPRLVTTLNEEAARHIFQSGRAVFMRNWPYAWKLMNLPDSPVAGRVSLEMVPHFPDYASAPTLGGFHVGVNARSPFAEEAISFVRFLIRQEVQKQILLGVGVLAAHTGIYDDAEVRRALPHLPELLPALAAVRPRPVTPY